MIENLTTPDGRLLEIMVSGPEDGFPLFFHNGTPSAVVPYAPIEDAVAAAGLRLVTCSRPGYGGSTPRPQSAGIGRLADDVADTVTVLDALSIDQFVTLGWSGGGPRALACAAMLPDRCRAATSLAGVAPYGVPGLDWSAGMGPENVRDFHLALEGREALRPVIEQEVAEFRAVTGPDIVAAFGELVDEVDAAALTGELAEYLAHEFRRSCEQGVAGLLEDNLVIVQPWGFEVADIAVPVSVWQGAHDKMVPFTHGQWLTGQLPHARSHLFDDEGHISLVVRMEEMFAELRELAGL